MGVSFQFTTQKMTEPFSTPEVDNVLRTGTKNARRCGGITRWAAS